ncbi:MAG: Glyoxalase/bleomycin resistance protein/dioxygenase [Ramlibacter sp.]|nr:Glyoxalase/bleomycin resistance protein/dioxygenase [Ramlibacter sp.]
MGNPVVHFEIPYGNRDRIVKFYEQAFGWTMNKLGEDMGNYVVAMTSTEDGPKGHRGAIDGGFYERKADWPDQYPSVVIAVKDVKAAMKKVKEAGGEILGEPMMIPGVGDYVSFRDTEGNRLSLLQPSPNM